MEFLGMGMGEILLVIIVALIIWGPNKLPEIARQIGKTVNSLRQTGSELTAQIQREIEDEEAAARNHSPHPEVRSNPKTIDVLPLNTPAASDARKTGETGETLKNG